MVERKDSFLREKKSVYACASRSGALFVGLTSKALEITRDEGKRKRGNSSLRLGSERDLLYTCELVSKATGSKGV